MSDFSIQAPPLVLNGQPVASAFHFDLDMGLSQADMLDKTFAFVNQSMSSGQGFLQNVINQSNAQLPMLLDKVTPIYAQQIALASQNQANATAAANNAASNSGGGGGGCFITTAVCEHDGKADDCEELTVLRRFRDTYMRGTAYREALVKRYYEIAPRIVEKVNALSDDARETVYCHMREYIRLAIAFIKRGDFSSAMVMYCDMVGYAEGVA